MRQPYRVAALFLLPFLAACGGSGVPSGAPAAASDSAPDDDRHTATTPAPWSAPPVPAAAVPAPYMDAWRSAENRASCALLALPHPPPGPAAADASPRTAQFGGGWGVAYDLPDVRSAFGVAGTGVEPGPDTYDDWPHHRAWRDGSRVGYGPEGGSGPNQLAYLRIPGETCLYNVWSRLGRTHLESLLDALRRVDTGWS